MPSNNRPALRLVIWLTLVLAVAGLLIAALTGYRMYSVHERLVQARHDCGSCCLGSSEGV